MRQIDRDVCGTQSYVIVEWVDVNTALLWRCDMSSVPEMSLFKAELTVDWTLRLKASTYSNVATG